MERKYRLLAYILTLILFAAGVTLLTTFVMWIASGLNWEVRDDLGEALAGRAGSTAYIAIMLLLLLFAACLRGAVWLSGTIARHVERRRRM